jgi:hypothetical protein
MIFALLHCLNYLLRFSGTWALPHSMLEHCITACSFYRRASVVQKQLGASYLCRICASANWDTAITLDTLNMLDGMNALSSFCSRLGAVFRLAHVLRVLAGTKDCKRLVISGNCHEQSQPRIPAITAESPPHLQVQSLAMSRCRARASLSLPTLQRTPVDPVAISKQTV